MSRRIVQIAAVSSDHGTERFREVLFALDNNGVAWCLEDPGLAQSKWQRLPELPSIATTRPPATVGPNPIGADRE